MWYNKDEAVIVHDNWTLTSTDCDDARQGSEATGKRVNELSQCLYQSGKRFVKIPVVHTYMYAGFSIDWKAAARHDVPRQNIWTSAQKIWTSPENWIPYQAYAAFWGEINHVGRPYNKWPTKEGRENTVFM